MEYKGFADIVEYHTHGSGGRSVEIIPAADFVAGRRSKGSTPDNASNYKDYALVLRRVWEQNKKALNVIRIDLEIQSERLCDAFREIATKLYDSGSDFLSYPIKLKPPFKELFFYRDEIKALAGDESRDAELRRDATVLSDFVAKNGLMSSLVDDHSKYVAVGKIPAEMLWAIYRPNSLVVVNADGIRECWICRDVIIQQTPAGYNWVLVGMRVGFNGYMPGFARKYYAFPPYGQRLCRIADLPVVPIEHCEDWPDVKAMLLARSANLQRILGPKLDSFAPQTYSGATWDNDFIYYNSLVDSVISAQQIDERVMADFQGMRNLNVQPPAGFLEILRLKQRQDKSKIQEKPRGMLIHNMPIVPAMPMPMPIVQPGIPQGMPQHMPMPMPMPPPPPKGRRGGRRHGPRRGHRHGRGHGYSSDSDSSDWELTGYDTPQFDTEQNGDILEYKSFGNSQEVRDYDTNEDDLDGLCRLAKECYGISDEDFQLLFPALIPAFGLKTKEWRWLLSDQLHDINWNTSAFESLQLEGGTKHLIQALVRGHKSKASFDDVVPGKGQGLIFLLHGKPGLGKTLTAESVADYLERPLYTIEGGELSTNATDLENDLNQIFELTRRWDAVSLLDEADVLLCKRKSSEMERNAVVAVFLRKIEYLQGVLFLTTNRRQDFDDAFKSRIHLTVSYPDLSEAAQSAIWKRLIATNRDINVDDLWVDEAYEALGKLGLNGRTIRNFLRTAVSFAHSRDEALGIGHVLEIIRTELKGEGYNVFSMSADEHAKMAKTNEALGDLQRLVETSRASASHQTK
ncbi:hypothetical protein BGZ63DRAFT_427648 [Mariannaea sp. PMI_226]|nr:hypothetical protein BGZ63DRAFT_427648 [Mariannaea sp. PMI_226]